MQQKTLKLTLCLIHEHAIATCLTKTCIIHKTPVRQKYDWMDPLKATWKDNQGTKIGQIIFLGIFAELFS
jgi:hypothetical protein